MEVVFVSEKRDRKSREVQSAVEVDVDHVADARGCVLELSRQ